MKTRIGIYCVLILLMIYGCGPGNHSSVEYEGTPVKTCFYTGSRGDVCWSLYEGKNKSNDSITCLLKAFLIPEGKLLFELPIKNADEIASYLNYGFDSICPMLIGDRIWSVVKNNNLEARNIYTGEILDNHQTLAVKFPELKPSVIKTTIGDTLPGFVLSSSNGSDYYYDLSKNVMITSTGIYRNSDYVFPKQNMNYFIPSADGNRLYFVEISESVNHFKKLNPETDSVTLKEKKAMYRTADLSGPAYKIKVWKRDNLFSVISFSRPQAANNAVLLGILNNRTGTLAWSGENQTYSQMFKDALESKRKIKIVITPTVLMIYPDEVTPLLFRMNLKDNQISQVDTEGLLSPEKK